MEALTMNDPADATRPHATRDAFLAQGMSEIFLDTALDCPICREPLMVVLGEAESTPPDTLAPAVENMFHVPIDDEAPTTSNSEMNNQSYEPATTRSNGDIVAPESAVRTLPCGHIFGRTCLTAWFTASQSNRCPECNQELFPNRYIQLFIREPTRAMRIGFADYVEEMCGDFEIAEQIRGNLMSDWTRSLIREFAMEIWRQHGYEVEYQYVSRGAAEEVEDEEDEDMTDGDEGESNGMGTDDEDDDEGQSKGYSCDMSKH